MTAIMLDAELNTEAHMGNLDIMTEKTWLVLFCSSMSTFTCRQSSRPDAVYTRGRVFYVFIYLRRIFLGENQLIKPQMKKS